MAHVLTWDGSGDRFYETGVDRGVLFVKTATGYAPGVAWNGLVSVTESPEGAEANDIYADNIKYLSLISAEDFKGTIECYTYPDDFDACNGVKDAGVDGLSVSQQERAKFAMVYRTLIGNDSEGTEKGYKLHFIWDMTAAPTEKAYATVNDSPEAITFSYEFSTIPTQVLSYTVTSGSEEQTIVLKATAHAEVDSTKFTGDTTKKGYLEALESFIYGTKASGSGDDTPAQMPTITQLYKLVTTGSAT